MSPEPTNETWEERFDDRFCQKEGCQAGKEVCGLKEGGKFICSTCSTWGGPEGVPKLEKRILGSAMVVKDFISEERKRAQEIILKDLYKQTVGKVNVEENVWVLRWIKQTAQSLGLSIKE